MSLVNCRSLQIRRGTAFSAAPLARPLPRVVLVSAVSQGNERSAGQPSTSGSSHQAPLVSISDALVAKDKDSSLKPLMQGYKSIKLSGVEFLVSTTEDGLLDLTDSYYVEEGKDEYKKPVIRGEVPKTRCRYQEVPWATFVTGNSFNFKNAQLKVLKMLLVRVQDGPSYQLDLESCFVIDSEKKEIFRPEIEKVGEPRFPILRFRRDRIVIEDEGEATPWAEVATEARLGLKNDNWWKRGAAEAAAVLSAAAAAEGAAAHLQTDQPAEQVDLDSLGDDNEAFDEDFFGEFEGEEEEGDDV